MNPKLQKQLFKKYPKILQKDALLGSIDTGDGWYPLIDRLCDFLQFHIDNNFIWNYSPTKKWISKYIAVPFHNFLYTLLYWSVSGNSDNHCILKHTSTWIDWLGAAKCSKPPQIKVAQIKDKFGGLRWYFDWSENTRTTSATREFCERMAGAVSFAESISYTICEYCGNPAKLMVKGGWYSTLCPKCAKKYGFKNTKKVS